MKAIKRVVAKSGTWLMDIRNNDSARIFVFKGIRGYFLLFPFPNMSVLKKKKKLLFTQIKELYK